MRPLVGLSTRRWSAAQVGDLLPTAYADATVDAGVTDYAAAVAGAGALPVLLTADADPEELAGRLDGLVLTGGADLGDEPERDAYELALLHAARARRLPVLCICRGTQLLNVACGGTLVADLPAGAGDGHPRWEGHRSDRVHRVELTAGSLASSVYGDSVTVNSMHHQSVDRLGDGLVVTGRSPDGTIEAIEAPGEPILAVQWHPEALGGDPAPAWLVAQALATAG